MMQQVELREIMNKVCKEACKYDDKINEDYKRGYLHGVMDMFNEVKKKESEEVYV